MFDDLPKYARLPELYVHKINYLHQTRPFDHMAVALILQEMASQGKVPKFWLFQMSLNRSLSGGSVPALLATLDAVLTLNARFPGRDLRVDRGNLEAIGALAAATASEDLGFKVRKLHR